MGRRAEKPNKLLAKKKKKNVNNIRRAFFWLCEIKSSMKTEQCTLWVRSYAQNNNRFNWKHECRIWNAISSYRKLHECENGFLALFLFHFNQFECNCNSRVFVFMAVSSNTVIMYFSISISIPNLGIYMVRVVPNEVKQKKRWTTNCHCFYFVWNWICGACSEIDTTVSCWFFGFYRKRIKAVRSLEIDEECDVDDKIEKRCEFAEAKQVKCRTCELVWMEQLQPSDMYCLAFFFFRPFLFYFLVPVLWQFAVDEVVSIMWLLQCTERKTQIWIRMQNEKVRQDNAVQYDAQASSCIQIHTKRTMYHSNGSKTHANITNNWMQFRFESFWSELNRFSDERKIIQIFLYSLSLSLFLRSFLFLNHFV